MKMVYLIGAGPMAEAYAKVLVALEVKFIVIGRGSASAERFKQNTGIEVELQMPSSFSDNDYCIVAVGVESLAVVSKQLIHRGAKHILVEKPGALNLNEMLALKELSDQFNALISIAYNRRFYSSIEKAKSIIALDGGVRSFYFEFTEWSHVIRPLIKAPGVKEAWLLANSSHVIDLAFYLAASSPKKISAYASGFLDWHNGPSKFAGSGITESGASFSYLADWEAPGRWGIEILTTQHRLIFRPLEQLHIQKLGSVLIEKVELNDHLDQLYKPGLYSQTKAFLANEKMEDFLTISEQIEKTQSIYLPILSGKAFDN
jgi:predicted dehydrogenase